MCKSLQEYGSRFSASRKFQIQESFYKYLPFSVSNDYFVIYVDTMYLVWQICSFSFAKIFRNWFHFTMCWLYLQIFIYLNEYLNIEMNIEIIHFYIQIFISELAVCSYKINCKSHIGEITGFYFLVLSQVECVLSRVVFFLYKVAPATITLF